MPLAITDFDFEMHDGDVQAAFASGANAAMEWYLSDLEGFNALACQQMAAGGATITQAPDEMRQAWAQGMDNAGAQWAAGLDGQGRHASAIMALYLDRMRAAGATPLRDWDKEQAIVSRVSRALRLLDAVTQGANIAGAYCGSDA